MCVFALLLVLFWPGQSDGGGRLDQPRSSLTRRIVAVADLHGDLEHALNVLSMAGVADAKTGRWTGSEHDVLVSTGDIVDRGDDTIALYQLFDQLRSGAGPHRVKNCLGNHEMMNALGDWRYVTPGDIESFGGEQQRRRVMSEQGWIGQTWLHNYSVSHTIALLPEEEIEGLRKRSELSENYRAPQANFVHGGIHPSWAAQGLDKINAVGHSLLRKALNAPFPPRSHLPPDATQQEASAYGEMGPFWYRGYAYESDTKACRLADEARTPGSLHSHGVDYLVMGHTPHLSGFIHRCKPPSIHLIDTGISRAYGGEQSALIFETTLRRQQGQTQTSSGARGKWIEERRLVALYKGRRPKTIYESERIL